MCRVNDSTLLLVGSKCMRTLNMGNDGSARTLGRPKYFPRGIDIGRCPGIVKVGNNILIGSESYAKKDLIYNIKKGKLAHFKHHKLRDGESQVVMEDESGTQMFNF